MFSIFYWSTARREDVNPGISLVRTSHGDVWSVITFKNYKVLKKKHRTQNVINNEQAKNGKEIACSLHDVRRNEDRYRVNALPLVKASTIRLSVTSIAWYLWDLLATLYHTLLYHKPVTTCVYCAYYDAERNLYRPRGLHYSLCNYYSHNTYIIIYIIIACSHDWYIVQLPPSSPEHRVGVPTLVRSTRSTVLSGCTHTE